VLPDLRLGAGAGASGAARVAAGAAIHRGHERETRWIRDRGRRTRDRDPSVLERLAQRLQRVPRELEQLVEKEHSVMRETHLARSRNAAAADEAGGGDRMMRRPKGTLEHARGAGQRAGDRMDAGDLERLLLRERGKNRRQPP